VTIAQDPTHPTGVADDSPRGSSAAVRARERKANSALQLKIAGASWEEIAEILGYPSGQHAQTATEGALERDLKSDESRKHLRGLNAKRLEKLLRSVWPKATDPQHPEHLAAIATARQLLDREAKLRGLDAPTEYVVSSPTVTEIEAWVNMHQTRSAPELEEADIFDAEVIEDSEGLVNDPSPEVHTVKSEQEA
jgi:hypothetical protein